MQKSTHLAESVEKTEYESQYDDCAKELVADIQVLARILQNVVEELKECDLQTIEDCIEGTPDISKIDVSLPEKRTEKIIGSNTESIIIHEGTVRFDIRFYIVLPGFEERIKIIINVEIQKKYRLKYHLVTRGIFYCARMLSEQLNSEFTADDYDDIKKVYSIWICVNTPEKSANTISEYKITRNEVYGKFDEEERYDLLTVVMIRLSEKEHADTEHALLKMLTVLFSNSLYAKIKKMKLENEFGMKMTREMKGGIDTMCNLSQVIKEEGREEGRLLASAEALLAVLEMLGEIPETLRGKIEKENNLNHVKKWFTLALQSETIEQFIKIANI